MPWATNHKAKHAAYMRAWRKTHPLTDDQRLKMVCRSYTKVMLKRGNLKREPCEVCGAAAQIHHPDYSQPMLVKWLCREHHLDLHKEFRVKQFDQPTISA